MKSINYNDILIDHINYIALISILLISPFLMNGISVNNIDSENTNSTVNHFIEKDFAADANICNDTDPFLLVNSMPFLSDEIKSNFYTCAAGGTGSQSCSLVGICSVSCFSGYYACCSVIWGCHCIKDDGGGTDPEEEGPP